MQWTKTSGSTQSFPFFRYAIKPFSLVMMRSTIEMMRSVTSSLRDEKQFSHTKTMTFATVKGKVTSSVIFASSFPVKCNYSS